MQIEVVFCGVCHSDSHQVKNEWANTVYPCVPGNEAVGRVTKIGNVVTAHAVGDIVGVGCIVDSCRHCKGPNIWLATYNGPMVPAEKAPGGKNIYGRGDTFGGYSDVLVVRDDFVIKKPPALKPEVAAPILCAGVTTYSPMKHRGVKAGQKVGVIRFGGLGDMAVKPARAMGAQVVVFTSTDSKLEEARGRGADAVLESDAETLPKRDGTLVLVGASRCAGPHGSRQQPAGRLSPSKRRVANRQRRRDPGGDRFLH